MLSTQYRLRMEGICKDIASGSSTMSVPLSFPIEFSEEVRGTEGSKDGHINAVLNITRENINGILLPCKMAFSFPLSDHFS